MPERLVLHSIEIRTIDPTFSRSSYDDFQDDEAWSVPPPPHNSLRSTPLPSPRLDGTLLNQMLPRSGLSTSESSTPATVPVNSNNHLEKTSYLDPLSVGCTYLPEYKVLICNACKYGLLGKPQSFADHFTRHHLRDISKSARKIFTSQLKTITAKLDIRFPPLYPLTVLPVPIPELHIHAGMKCDHCLYASREPKTMQRHVSKNHPSSSSKAWSVSQVQRFFTSQHMRIFPVGVADANLNAPRPSNTAATTTNSMNEDTNVESLDLLLSALENYEDNLDKSPYLSQQPHLSPWLTRTRWATHLANVDLSLISQQAQLPKPRTPEALHYDPLLKAIVALFTSCHNHVQQNCPPSILRWARSYHPDKPSPAPFRIVQDKTFSRYLRIWVKFICYCVKVSSSSVSEVSPSLIILSPEQQSLLDSLRLQLLSPIPDVDILSQHIFDFSLLIIRQPICASTFESPLIHFLSVLGIDPRTVTFRSPLNYTTNLAGCIYCCRILGMSWAIRHTDKERLINPAYLPQHAFEPFRKSYLIDIPDTPFGEIVNQLAYGIKVKTATTKNLIQWSEDRFTVYWASLPIELDSIRLFISSQIRYATDILKSGLHLTNAMITEVEDCMPSLYDDMSNADNGYYFLKDNRNRALYDKRTSVLKRLTQDDLRPLYFVPGSTSFKATAVMAYQENITTFLSHLLILFHVTGGQPARGSEITSLLLQNSKTLMRNIYLYRGYVFYLTMYHKAQSRTGKQKAIPRFLPDCVGVLFVAYALYVLPVSRALESVLDKSPIPSTFQPATVPLSFLWCNGDNKPWSTAQFSKLLSAGIQPFINAGTINVAVYRHLAIDICREFLRPQIQQLGFDTSDQEAGLWAKDSLWDYQAGHSTSVANEHYGLRVDMLRSFSVQSLAQFHQLSRTWYDFWKLRPENNELLVSQNIVDSDEVEHDAVNSTYGIGYLSEDELG